MEMFGPRGPHPSEMRPGFSSPLRGQRSPGPGQASPHHQQQPPFPGPQGAPGGPFPGAQYPPRHPGQFIELKHQQVCFS